jgi:glycosyltransferase involved in cell wall biosynthesis
VVPIRVGSGSRLKALEGLALGRPVVGTTIGLEGLDLAAGAEALVADDAVTFAGAVIRLLGDDHLASSLARDGRAAVEARFSWSAIADAFATAVVAIAESATEHAAAEPVAEGPG